MEQVTRSDAAKTVNLILFSVQCLSAKQSLFFLNFFNFRKFHLKSHEFKFKYFLRLNVRLIFQNL